jgi:putative inorganic carbon (hco3(-)) transporter
MSSDRTILTHPLSRAIYYLLLSTIPFYYWRQAFPGIPFDWVLAIILLIIIFIHLVSTKRFPEVFFNNLNIWFLLFFLINIISSLFSEFRASSLTALLVLLQAYGFLVINLFFLNEKAVSRLPLVLGLSIGLNSLIASLGYFFGMEFMNTWDGVTLTTGVTLGANTLSLMCVFVIPILVYGLLHAVSAGSFFLYAGLIFINICGIISSESRGGFLHLIILLILLLFFHRNRFQPRFLGFAISFIALAVLIVGTAIPDKYFERQKTLLSEPQAQDDALRRRAAYIRVGMRSFTENPFIGTGTGSFPKIWVQSRETLYFKMEERATHNVYLEVLVHTGLIGLLFFLGLLLQALRDIVKSIQNFDFSGNNRYKDMGISYLISFLVICSYGLIKNLLDFKLFILIIPLSQVMLFISKKDKQRFQALD